MGQVASGSHLLAGPAAQEGGADSAPAVPLAAAPAEMLAFPHPSVSEGVASAGQPHQVGGGKGAGSCAAAAALPPLPPAPPPPRPPLRCCSSCLCCLEPSNPLELFPHCPVRRTAAPWLQPAGMGEFVGEFVPPAAGDHGAQSLLAGGFQGETSGELRSSALLPRACHSWRAAAGERQIPLPSQLAALTHRGAAHHCICLVQACTAAAAALP